MGGCLKNATINFYLKHPAIILKNNKLSRIIRFYHKNNLHCGSSLTFQIIQKQFWIINGRSTVHKELRKCVMDHLPTNRITLTRPFNYSRVDYIGSYEIASKTSRGSKIIKVSTAAIVIIIV